MTGPRHTMTGPRRTMTVTPHHAEPRRTILFLRRFVSVFFQCLKNVFLQQLFPYGYQKNRIWSDFETVEKWKKLLPTNIYKILNEFPCCSSFSTVGKSFRTSNFLPVTFLATFSNYLKSEYSDYF
jgi:hypothetical protein